MPMLLYYTQREICSLRAKHVSIKKQLINHEIQVFTFGDQHFELSR